MESFLGLDCGHLQLSGRIKIVFSTGFSLSPDNSALSFHSGSILFKYSSDALALHLKASFNIIDLQATLGKFLALLISVLKSFSLPFMSKNVAQYLIRLWYVPFEISAWAVASLIDQATLKMSISICTTE